MRNRLVLGWVIVLMATAGQARADDAPKPDAAPATPPGNVELADFFAGLGQQMITTPGAPTASWSQRAALLKQASLMNPKDSRLQKQLADTLIYIQDFGDALPVLKTYCNMEWQDQFAQTELIDLTIGGMQTADKKIDYLHQVLGTQKIVAEVRSFAAVRCAQIYQQQADEANTMKMLDTALQLNHVNVIALRMKFGIRRAKADCTEIERINLLLKLEEANPADPNAAVMLGTELADLGMVNQSLGWFNIANKIYIGSGILPDPVFVHGVGSELVLQNADDQAVGFLTQYLTTVPDDIDAWYIRLSVLKSAADQFPNDKVSQTNYLTALQAANNAMVNRLQQIRHAAGVTGATTQPVDGPTEAAPDLTGDLALLQAVTKKAGNAQLADSYITTVSGLAWMDIYFRQDNKAAEPVLTALDPLLNPDDPLRARLLGWRLLVNGDPAAAVVKLSAIADRDPFAALGMVIVHQKSGDTQGAVPAEAKKLIERYPSGAVGAIIFSAFAKLDLKVDPLPKAANVAPLINAFPVAFLQILDTPQNFYRLRAEPARASYAFGQPMMATVTLENINTQYDISVGSEGILHNDVWLDGNLRGQVDAKIPGVAYDRITQALVLHPGQHASVVVRLDDGLMAGILHHNPNASIAVSLSVISNPMVTPPATAKDLPEAKSGVGGYSQSVSRMLQREGASIEKAGDRARWIAQASRGDAGDRICAMEVLAAYISVIHAQENAQPPPPAAMRVEMDKIIDEITGPLNRGMNDSIPAVRAMSLYLLAVHQSGQAQTDALKALSTDPDTSLRLLAIAAAQEDADALGAAGKAVISERSVDTDPIVKLFALATAAVITPPAAPATQPTAEPAVGSGAGGATAPASGGLGIPSPSTRP